MKESKGWRADQRKCSARCEAAADDGGWYGVRRGCARGNRRKVHAARHLPHLLVLLGLFPLPALAADANGLYGLAQLPGTISSTAVGISADGSTVVGVIIDGIGAHPVFWSSAGGSGELLGPSSISIPGDVSAISADGRVIVGANGFDALRWVGGNAYSLPTPLYPLGVTKATAVSADGNVIVGWSAITTGDDEQAYRWVAGATVGDRGTGTLLGTLASEGYTLSNATGVSADGKVIVGWAGAVNPAGQSTDSKNRYPHAFIWRQNPDPTKPSMYDLGTLYPGVTHDTSFANGISGDGKVVVGNSAIGGLGLYDGTAVRWDISWNQDNTVNSRIQSLGMLCNRGTCYSVAYAANKDGTVIVGNSGEVAYAGNKNHPSQQGFRWTAQTGMQTVEQWLAASGVKVSPSLHTFSANAVNDKGDVVVGQLQDGNGQGGVAFYARAGIGLFNEGDVQRTLIASAYPHVVLANTQTDMALHGAHGTPLRGLLKAGQQDFFVTGDWGRQDHGITQGDIGAGEIGYARGFSNNVMARLAVGRTYSVNQTPYSGFTSLSGTYVVPEVVALLPGTPLYASATGYYNSGSAYVKRVWINSGNFDTGSGEPNVAASGLRLRLDWKDAFSLGRTTFTPYTSVTWMQSRVAGYTESAATLGARWDSRSEHSTQARLGFDAAYPLNDHLQLQARAEGVHRFESVSSGATGEVPDAIGSIIQTFQFPGIQYKQNWMRVGFGLEGKLGPGFASAMINATTEADTPSAWVYASYRMSF